MQLAIAFTFVNGHVSKVKKITPVWISCSYWTLPKEKESSPWGQSGIGAGCTGGLCSLCHWRFSDWTKPQSSWSELSPDPNLRRTWDLVNSDVPSSISVILHWDITSGNGLDSSYQIFPLVAPFPDLGFIFAVGSFTGVPTPNLRTSASQPLTRGISELTVLCLLREIKQEIYLSNVFSCLALTTWQMVLNSGPLEEGSWRYAEVCGDWGAMERTWLTLRWEQYEWEPVPAGNPQAFLRAFTNRQQTQQLLVSTLCCHSFPHCLLRFFLKSFLSIAPSFIPFPTLAIFSQTHTLYHSPKVCPLYHNTSCKLFFSI